MDGYQLRVLAGASNLKLQESTQQAARVESLQMHPLYDSR